MVNNKVIIKNKNKRYRKPLNNNKDDRDESFRVHVKKNRYGRGMVQQQPFRPELPQVRLTTP